MKKTSLFIVGLLLTVFTYSAQAVQVQIPNPNQSANCSAGNLAAVASSYLATVKNLTLTGTIDARDFKTMRDAMPLLEALDMSGCTIVGYSGTAGTAGTTSTVYPDNGIPIFSFCSPANYSGKLTLKSIVFPPSVTAIGEKAFLFCSGLTGLLTLPDKVQTIGSFAFHSCSGLSGSLVIPSSVTAINDCAFTSCSGFTGSLSIPSSVTEIGSSAFSFCSGFNGVLVIPSSVKIIGTHAFDSCSGLTGSLSIPSSVTAIGQWAFAGCNSFTGSFTIPPYVTTIDTAAFYGCSGLKGSITIPSTVTVIGDSAFKMCTGLTSINASAITPINISASSDVFGGVNKTTCILHVPVDSKGAYEGADQWKDFINIVADITTTSLDESFSNSISIFPNPAASYLTISELGSLVSDKTVTLSVIDVSGNSLLVKNFEPTTDALTIDVSPFKSGVYFVVFQTSKGQFVKRFVKE